jgi:hypothetical protein
MVATNARASFSGLAASTNARSFVMTEAHRGKYRKRPGSPMPATANAASSASGHVAKASDYRSNATGRAPSTSGTNRLDGAAGFRSAAAASVGGSAARSAVDWADAPAAATAQEAGLPADDLLVGLAAARAAQARSS